MNVLVEHRDRIATVTLNRPEKLNALDASLLVAIGDAFEEIRSRGKTRCVIVTGAGKAFAAGADIAAIAELDAEAAKQFSLVGKNSFNKIERFNCPVIGAINGFALGGGCELAMACDFLIASDKAKFGLPEVKLGVVPGFGGMQRMSARVGAGVAREMLYTGRIFNAEAAVEVGLVNRVVASDELLDTCNAIADEIAAAGPTAVREAKRTLANSAGGLSDQDDQEDSTAFGALFGTPDQIEGMQAFVEKRAAEFRDE